MTKTLETASADLSLRPIAHFRRMTVGGQGYGPPDPLTKQGRLLRAAFCHARRYSNFTLPLFTCCVTSSCIDSPGCPIGNSRKNSDLRCLFPSTNRSFAIVFSSLNLLIVRCDGLLNPQPYPTVSHSWFSLASFPVPSSPGPCIDADDSSLVHGITRAAAFRRPFLFALSRAPARGKPCRGARASAYRKVACGPRSWNYPFHAVQGHQRALQSRGGRLRAAFCCEARRGSSASCELHHAGSGVIASMAETPRGFLQAGERALRLSERRPAVRGGETFAVQGRQRARLIHGPPGRLGGLSCGCDRETLYQTNDDC